jgi:hypothetical protein
LRQVIHFAGVRRFGEAQVSSIQDIPIAKIRESKTNPRRFFDEEKLAELADFVPWNKIRVMFRIRLCGRSENHGPQILCNQTHESESSFLSLFHADYNVS